MLGLFERIVAFRYLRARRAEGFISVISWFSLLGIALGVATLIIVMAVMNGFRAELFNRILGLNGHLNVFSETATFTDWPLVLAQLKDIDGVVAINPSIEGQALISQRGQATGVLVRALRPQDFAAKKTIADKIVSGRVENFVDENVAIGQRLAQRLGVRVGDEITLVSPTGKATAFGTMPRLRAYRIGAIYDVGMYEYDNGFVFMPLAAAQGFFNMGESVTSLEIFTNNPHRMTAVMEKISAQLGAERRVMNWQHMHASFVNALQVERNVMFLILTLIILVAAFNIISGL
ncbi:MAG: lipoprotein-releasing system transmembrane subunit LolC, partial [Alphaproteobacteria bacterium]|nr:lipoprotein-releasing system transmembrane subunit LolC [Alphaproteobacteria bacterium]